MASTGAATAVGNGGAISGAQGDNTERATTLGGAWDAVASPTVTSAGNERAPQVQISARDALNTGALGLADVAVVPAQARDGLVSEAAIQPAVQIGPVPEITLAQAGGGYRVDLPTEELHGGHTIARHVGKSPQALMARVNERVPLGPFFSAVPRRAGSFPSLQAAERLVNSTLAQNAAVVQQVANGDVPRAFVTAEFASQTGIEAYRPAPRAQPYIRDTYGVGVVIQYDPNRPSGFTVISAYPRNE